MSALLLTNPFAPQAGPPSGTSLALAYGTAGALTPQAVTPTTSATKTTGGGSSTAYDGQGAGAGGAASRQTLRPDAQPPRPADATPRSVVDALAQREARDEAAPTPDATSNTAKVIDMAERTRKQAQEMPLPLPNLPFLLPTASENDQAVTGRSD